MSNTGPAIYDSGFSWAPTGATSDPAWAGKPAWSPAAGVFWYGLRDSGGRPIEGTGYWGGASGSPLDMASEVPDSVKAMFLGPQAWTSSQGVYGEATDPGAMGLFKAMANMLSSMGLGDLFKFQGGKPSGWLWDTIIERGWTTEDEILVALEEVPQFKTRFKVMFDLRERAAKGEPVQVPTPAEIRQYEEQAAQMFRQYGLPHSFYDSYTDFQTLIGKGLSLKSLQERIGTAYNDVVNAPPEVRSVFEQYFGVRGDDMLAATFLDPDYVDAHLDRMSRMAQVGGIGRQLGFEIAKPVAEELALAGASAGDRSRLAGVAALAPAFTETVGETGNDLQAGREGVQAAFGTNAGAQVKVRQRLQEREAAFGGGGEPTSGRTGYGVGQAY